MICVSMVGIHNNDTLDAAVNQVEPAASVRAAFWGRTHAYENFETRQQNKPMHIVAGHGRRDIGALQSSRRQA